MYRFGAALHRSKGKNKYAMYKASRSAVTIDKVLQQEICVNAVHDFGMRSCREDMVLPEAKPAI